MIMDVKTTCVGVLFGSRDGLTSRETASGRSGVMVMGLVDWMFFCCIRRWPLLVASDFGKYLVIREEVRPGHVLKWPR